MKIKSILRMVIMALFAGFAAHCDLLSGTGDSAIGDATGNGSTAANLPDAPAGLVASAGQDGTITLSWNAVTGADGYNIYRNANQGVIPITLNSAGTTITQSFIDSYLVTSGNTYYYVVTSYNNGGESAPSNEVNATSFVAIPTGLVAMAGNGIVTLTWDDVPGSFYQIYRSTMPNVSPVLGNNVFGCQNCFMEHPPYIDTSVSNGITYYYIITKGGGTLQSLPSNEVSATPQAIPQGAPPSKPTGLTATAGDSSVTLAWTASAGASGYCLYRNTSPGATPAYNGSCNNYIYNSPYTDLVINGTTYYYFVTALNSSGDESGASNEISVTPSIAVPTALMATAGDNATVILTWNNIAGTTYNVYRSTSPNVSVTSGNQIASFATSPFTDVGTNGTTYYYVVTTQGIYGGESLPSPEVSATPFITSPTGVMVSPGDGMVTLTWTAISGEYYNIYRSVAPGVTTTGGNKIASYVTSPYIDYVTNGITYYYVLTKIGAFGGESLSSMEISATPQLAIPGVPTGVLASHGDTQATVSWNTVSGATSYNVYWSNTAGVTIASNKITGVTSPYNHSSLTNGITYYYAVSAINSGGESALSSEVSATPQVAIPDTPTGILVFPTGGKVTLLWPVIAGATEYNIYWSTSSGVNLLNGTKISNIPINTYTHTGLTNGITYYYIVTAVNSGGESSPSTEINATLPVIPPPINVSATSGIGQISVSWSTVTGATSYNIYWQTSTGITTTNGTLIANASAPYLHIGLTGGSTYYYIVTAVNAGGESAASLEVNASAFAPPIDNNNGSVYISSQNLTWAKCSQADLSGANMYNSATNDCTGTTAGTFQYCSNFDHSCDNYSILNGTGLSGVWNTCAAMNNSSFAGRSTWRVPTGDELIAFYNNYVIDAALFPNIGTTYWSSSNYSLTDAYALYFVGPVYYNVTKTNYLYVRCVSDGP